MKGTKDLKTNKGITLIALVITIIVMLILVAVTISMAVNGGLFEYARNAGTKTNAAVQQEQILASGRINVNNVWYDSIDAYIANTPSKIQGGEMPTKITITGQNIVDGKITLEVGDSITLGATLDKGQVTASDIEWNNSNKDAVKVENGVITALNSTKGTATITAKFNTLVDTIEIEVKSKLIGNCTNCTNGIISGYPCTVCGVISKELFAVKSNQVKCLDCEKDFYASVDNTSPECISCASFNVEINNWMMGFPMEIWGFYPCGHVDEPSPDPSYSRIEGDCPDCVGGKIYNDGNS